MYTEKDVTNRAEIQDLLTGKKIKPKKFTKLEIDSIVAEWNDNLKERESIKLSTLIDEKINECRENAINRILNNDQIYNDEINKIRDMEYNDLLKYITK